MLLEKMSEIERNCTGCSLCSSLCPVKAIKMTPDKEGFFKPAVDMEKCVGCGKCEAACPQLNTIKENKSTPACYAVKASEPTLKVSSSGGAFSVLAEYVFERNGYVCGAAYDDDFMGVSHIMISDRSDMYKLRGSKYVYSKPGDIYKQVKEKLDEGKYVLFSGTPCQVAALNAFLPKKYDELITVDIICTGVPSEKIYRQYMTAISHGKKVTGVNFRPKEFGWYYSGIQVKFADGTEHMIHSVRDPYIKGFLGWLYQSNACKKCSFAAIPRQADFTIGDFWHIEKYDESIDTECGVSSILLNNAKAENIFNEVRDKFAFSKRIRLSFLTRFNQLHEVRKGSPARSRFFSLIDKGWSFERAVDYALNWKFDIAVTGCWTVRNYGGELTYYVLYRTLQDMGYSVIMVERRKDIPKYNTPIPKVFAENPYPYYDVCRIHKDFKDQCELNTRVKNFILGSDQVWNFTLMGDSMNSYTLDYVAPYRKKITYSSSFGSRTFSGTEEQKQEFQKLLSSFNYVAVREHSGVEICKEMGIHAQWVLDPFFICKKEVYHEVAAKATAQFNGRYLFFYYVVPDKYKVGLDEMCRVLKIDYIGVLSAGERFMDMADVLNYPYIKNCSLENWLGYIINSSMLVTDSFHATCLAIIFHIPFVYIKGAQNIEHGLDRAGELLNMLGLDSVIADDVRDAINRKIYEHNFDWDSIDRILNEKRSQSIDWLKNAIESDIL